MAELRTIRVYEPIGDADGQRVLADRLWPRGVRKDDPRIGIWLPGLAPSAELRGWYGHRPERRTEFARQYRAELDAIEPADAPGAVDRESVHDPAIALAVVQQLIAAGTLTLTTATKEIESSELPILVDFLRQR